MKYEKIKNSVLRRRLKEHKEWLKNPDDTEALYLLECDLRRKAFKGKDLSNAVFRSCNLTNAVFENCKLEETDFTYSVLDGAIFRNCNMNKSIFYGSDLSNVVIEKCNLSYAKFPFAVLNNIRVLNSFCGFCSFYGVEYNVLDFTDSDFYLSFLDCIDFDNILNPERVKNINNICPKDKDIIGWKICADDKLVKLFIPKEAVKLNGTSNKCRCNKAKVLKITDLYENIEYPFARSIYDENFIYRKNEEIHIKNFDYNRWHNCTNGIHFFLNKKEAIKYIC